MFPRFSRRAEPTHRVLIVIQNLPLALDRRVRTECRALLDAGYGVSVICPKQHADEPDEHVLDDVVVHSYPTPPAARGVASYVREFVTCWVHTARRSWQVARAEGFDALQACNPPDTYWLLGLLWKMRGNPFIYDQHDLSPEVYEARFSRRGPLHRALLLLERLTYRVADHVICPNPSYQEVALERGALPVTSTSVVMSSPDATTMRRGDPVAEYRAGRADLVCYVGIMGPQDGVDRLLQAVAHYVHVLDRRDTHFALLGFGDSLDELRQMSERLHVTEWVTFTGPVDHTELSRWLSTADLGVTPDPPSEFNHRSTMNKTLEYMAHEVPVVATELRETRRCAGGAAEYVPDGDPALMAKTIAAVLDDPSRRTAMGAEGRHRIEHDFAWSDQARTYVAVYDHLLTTQTRTARTSTARGTTP